MSKDIKVTGALVFPENVPTRAGEVVNSIGEIYDIPAPRVGMTVYDKSTGINYIVRSLKAKVIDGVQVDNAQVDMYEEYDVNEAKKKLIDHIQGTSQDSDAVKDPFKFIGNYDGFEALMEKLDTMHNVEGVTGSSVHNGHFRALVGSKLVEIVNEAQGYAYDVWSQRITCAGIVLRNGVVKTETSYTDFSDDEGHKYRQRRYVQKFVDAVSGGAGFDGKGSVKTFCRRHHLTGDDISTWTPWYDVENPYVQTQNYGKKIALFGASFAQNMAVSGYEFTHEGTSYKLADYIAEKLGAVAFDDYAVGGQGMRCDDNSPFPVHLMNQLKTAQSKGIYDIYIIMGGVNDYWCDKVPLGESTGYASGSSDDEEQNISYCGGLLKAIDYIRVNAPNAKIYTITPFKGYNAEWGWNPRTKTRNAYGNSFYEFVQAQKEVSQVKGVPCLDLWAMQGFSGANASEHYISDLLHPNGNGYYKASEKIVEFVAHGVGSEVVDVQALMFPTNEKNVIAISAETTRAKQAERNLDDKITAEIQRAKDAEKANTDAINAEKERAKQAEQANRQLIADLVGESPETLDTIHEISSWILNDKTGAAAMAKEINENKNAINTEKERAKQAERNLGDKITTLLETKGNSIVDIEISPNESDVELDLTTLDDKTTHISLPAATTESAGVMTAEDKEKLAMAEGLFRSFEIVDNNIYSLPKLRPITFTDGVLLRSDGTTTTNEYQSTSDYIQGNGCFIKLYSLEYTKSFTSICLYDEENNFLTSYDLGEGEHFVYIRRDLKARISVPKGKKNLCGYCIQDDGVPTSLNNKVGELDTKVLELERTSTNTGNKLAMAEGLFRSFEIVDNNIYSLPKLRPITFTDGVLLRSDGTTTTNEYQSTSDYIQGNGCFIKLYSLEYTKSFTSICLYDEENNFLTSYDLGEGEHFVYIRRDLKARISVPKGKKNLCGYCIQDDGVPTSLNSKVAELDAAINDLKAKDTSTGLEGVKISWFGTSIPRQGYPQLVGNITGATVYNEAYGSSGARRGAKNTDFEDDPYRIKGLQWPRPVYGLMMSAIERDEVISNWADYVDTWSGKFEGEEGAPTNAKPQNINDGSHEELKAILRDLCYDVRVARHCGINHEYNRGIDAALCSDGTARPVGFTDMSDIYIIEHGFNDAEGNGFADNVEDYNKIPENPYDVNTAIGSINALIRYIYSHNQQAKILLVGHYENETTRGIWATNTIEQVAKYWGIPLCKLYDVIGASQRTIPTNGYWNNNKWEKSGFSFTTNGESWTSNNYALLYSMVAGVSVGTIANGVIVGNNATLLKEKLGITEGDGTAQWMPTRRMMLMQDDLHPASSTSKKYWAEILSGYIYSLFK